METIEEILAKIKAAGGEVKYKKAEGTNDVQTLFIQTVTMKKNLARNKPTLFESDTTFGTQSEGYKTWCAVFYDHFVGKWEVAGIVMLSTESHENVEDGLKFFKDSLNYAIGGTKWIFFVDKDFDYITVLEIVFDGAIVLLCNVHTGRYFREKVLTNKAFYGDPEDYQYLGKYDKDDLMDAVLSVRDSPSEELYIQREAELIEKTKDLSVRPGQNAFPVKFEDYYNKNWKSCSVRWVRAFRKNLPLNGVMDTQAAESTFSAIKRFIRRKFPGRKPTLAE